jgi:hypothetical protein
LEILVREEMKVVPAQLKGAILLYFLLLLLGAVGEPVMILLRREMEVQGEAVEELQLLQVQQGQEQQDKEIMVVML